MITIYHGDDLVKSRDKLNQTISAFKLKDADVIHLDSKNLEPELLIQSLESNPIFTDLRLTVIENLFSLPQSKLKNKLIDSILNLDDRFKKREVIIWEKKALTPATKKKLVKTPNIKLTEFKLAKVIFQLLDSLKPNNSFKLLSLYQKALKTNPVELIFYLISRRVSQLIQAKTDTTSIKGAPWQITRLCSQVKNFNLNALLKLHQNLLSLDTGIKTGKNPISLTTQLDLLLINL